MPSYSYTFIEKSVRNGVLEELQNHRAGPVEGTVRTIGSVVQPAKGTRNKFTDGDDQILWEWVREHPQNGGGTDGNEIYKELETKVRRICSDLSQIYTVECPHSTHNTLGSRGGIIISNISRASRLHSHALIMPLPHRPQTLLSAPKSPSES